MTAIEAADTLRERFSGEVIRPSQPEYDSARRVFRAWALVWIGNFAGASGTAALVFLSEHHMFGAGQVGVTALRIAEAKAALPFGRALAL